MAPIDCPSSPPDLPSGGQMTRMRWGLMTCVAGVLGACSSSGTGGPGQPDAGSTDDGPTPGAECPDGSTTAVSPLGLVPEGYATHRAVQSGAWDDPEVWQQSAAPADGARVFIEPGVTVTIAGEERARLETLRVDGTLRFDPSVDTHLSVDTIVSAPDSAIEIGTEEQPIEPDVTAQVSFADLGPPNDCWDPERLSRGLLVNGDLQIHGAEKTTWTPLESAPQAGAQAVTLPAPPAGWEAGDRVVIPGLDPSSNQDEERRIASIDGSTVQLDAALEHDHVPPASELDTYILNLSRNVAFQSESEAIPRRGHIMIMSTETDVRYAQLHEMGRTDKSRPFTDPVRGVAPEDAERNPKARYPFHYHITGIEAPPHVVEGLVVDGGPGWGVVNHHAHAEVRDSITYRVLGSGFVTEAGNERGLYERNFALRSEGSGEIIDSRKFDPKEDEPGIDDFGHGGHGFWLQGPLVEVSDNVAAGHRHYGFVFWNRPLIDWELPEGAEVANRVGTVPNLPLEYVEGQVPLKEAIEAGRDAPGEYADYEGIAYGVSSDGPRVSSAFVPIQRFEGNVAFASGGGIDVSRHQFRWWHHRYDEYGVIDDFTVYGIGPLVTKDGETRGAIKGGVKPGGNQAASFRYSANITIRNSRFIGSDLSGVGVSAHDYLFTRTIEDSTIEGFQTGIVSGEHELTLVRGNTFDNDTDVAWLVGNVGALIAQDNDFGPLKTADVDHTLSYRDVKAGELLGFSRTRGTQVDGRRAYFAEQRPDYVPVTSKEELVQVTVGSGYGNMAEVIGHDDPEVVIGMTNQELFDQFGVATGGALLPENAVEEPFVTGGLLDPAEIEALPEATWLETEAGSVGDGFDVVSDVNASEKQAIRVNATGTSGPPTDASAVTRLEFDVAAGTYTAHARIFTKSWNGDDLWTRIDGGEWVKWNKLKPPRGFKWYSLQADGEPITFELAEGAHTIEIGCESEGVKIDKLLLASDQTTADWLGSPADNL